MACALTLKTPNGWTGPKELTDLAPLNSATRWQRFLDIHLAGLGAAVPPRTEA